MLVNLFSVFFLNVFVVQDGKAGEGGGGGGWKRWKYEYQVENFFGIAASFNKAGRWTRPLVHVDPLTSTHLCDTVRGILLFN